MKRNVAIVGSGFAAWGAAVALVRQGDVSVTLFDIGLTQAGSDMANKPVHNAKKCDGSFYCYGVNDPDFPVQLNSLRICSSHAFGGHSNVYSGAVLYPKNHDLSDWPEASLPQAEDYAAVLSKSRILHQPDALDNFFPMPPDFLTISEKKTAETVSVAGMSRIALRQPDNQNEDLPARLFSAREEFKSMVSLGLLAYTGGCYVSHAISRDGRVELSYNINGSTGAATFDAVFLGAGCVNTTAIVDRSVHPPGSRDFSIRAPRLAIHAFFRIPWKDDPASRIRRQNGLPEYFLEVRSPLTGDAENALGEHGFLVMFDFGWIARIWNGIAQGVDQARTFVDFTKQQNAGVGGDSPAIKITDDLLGSEAVKPEQIFSTRCHERKALS